MARPRAIWLVAVALGLASFTVSVVLPLLHRPDFYQPVSAADPLVVADAQQVEHLVASEMTRIRPVDQPAWRIDLTQDQINRWLAVRLPQWLANQQIDAAVLEQIGQPMIAFTSRGIEAAAQAEWAGVACVMRLIYQPEVDADGVVTLKLSGVRIGAMPVGRGVVESMLADDVARGMSGMVGELPLRLPLGDGRAVEVIGMQVRGERVTLVCRTVSTAATN
jgi:uncharacterized protein YpmS